MLGIRGQCVPELFGGDAGIRDSVLHHVGRTAPLVANIWVRIGISLTTAPAAPTGRQRERTNSATRPGVTAVCTKVTVASVTARAVDFATTFVALEDKYGQLPRRRLTEGQPGEYDGGPGPATQSPIIWRLNWEWALSPAYLQTGENLLTDRAN